MRKKISKREEDDEAKMKKKKDKIMRNMKKI